MTLSPNSIPKFRRGILRKFDAARGQNVLLGPERVILLDDIANAITELCDGNNTVADISSILAQRYGENLAQVEPDVLGFIQQLLDKGLVAA